MAYETILTEVRGAGDRRTGLITLNRPKALNALNDQLMNELGEALLAFTSDWRVRRPHSGDPVGCAAPPWSAPRRGQPVHRGW